MSDEHRIKIDLLREDKRKVYDIHGLDVYLHEKFWILTNKECAIRVTPDITLEWHVGKAAAFRLERRGFHHWITFIHEHEEKSIIVECKEPHVKMVTKLNFAADEPVAKS